MNDLPDSNWEDQIAGTNRLRSILKFLHKNFLLQRKPASKGALIDSLLLNKEGLVGEMATGDYFGHCDHEVVQFKIFSDWRNTATKTSALDMQRAVFTLLKQFVKFPVKFLLKVLGFVSTDRFLRTPFKIKEQVIPKCQKLCN